MTAKHVEALAKSLDVGLHSPGVCPMCLLLVATGLEREEGPSRRGSDRLAVELKENARRAYLASLN